MRTVLLGVATFSLLPAAPLPAQEAPLDTALVRATTARLRSDLRNFLTAQERHFADHGTYAGSAAALRTYFRPSSGVTLVLLTASDTAHSEIAIDERVPDLVCAMYVGNAPPPMGRGDEGEVVCRGP